MKPAPRASRCTQQAQHEGKTSSLRGKGERRRGGRASSGQRPVAEREEAPHLPHLGEPAGYVQNYEQNQTDDDDRRTTKKRIKTQMDKPDDKRHAFYRRYENDQKRGVNTQKGVNGVILRAITKKEPLTSPQRSPPNALPPPEQSFSKKMEKTAKKAGGRNTSGGTRT